LISLPSDGFVDTSQPLGRSSPKPVGVSLLAMAESETTMSSGRALIASKLTPTEACATSKAFEFFRI
jgi:hypothetical protein